VISKEDPYSVTLPHIVGEWEGCGKGMEKAVLKSAYDGAALVYARNEALAYVGNPDPARHAKVLSFATDGTWITFFAHYAAQSWEGKLEYHQYPIAWTSLVNSYEGFKQGRRQLRNLQDYAMRLSYTLGHAVQERYKRHQDSKQVDVKETLVTVPDGKDP